MSVDQDVMTALLTFSPATSRLTGFSEASLKSEKRPGLEHLPSDLKLIPHLKNH